MRDVLAGFARADGIVAHAMFTLSKISNTPSLPEEVRNAASADSKQLIEARQSARHILARIDGDTPDA